MPEHEGSGAGGPWGRKSQDATIDCDKMMKIAADPVASMGLLAGRFRSAIEWRIYRPLHVKSAAMCRSRLDGVTFVGITGSAGKTSARSEEHTSALQSLMRISYA